ncbi:MAG: hypothetical protein IPJ41_06830 [Phycisphaerales bacterium]|nr:hypothetical protein [Phycisphaerales bacterium]
MTQAFDTTPYRRKKLRFFAVVRVEVKSSIGDDRAQLWLSVDRPGRPDPFWFDNMWDRPIVSRDWSRHEIAGRIDDDAESINIGIMAFGDATVWIDDLRFEGIERESPGGG